MKKLNYLFLLVTFFLSCNQEKKLPFLGKPVAKNGKKTFPKIPAFTFTNQNGKIVTEKNFEEKIYVADFIFLNCPTICPIMSKELKKVYDVFQHEDKIKFISHTIDPKNDTVDKLKAYSNSLNINANKWYFVTGNEEEIYNLATQHYFTIAYKDSKEPGGYVHSGGLLLIDKNKHIRGVYDGTNEKETNRLIHDIEILLKE